ncbi:hypothetical protein AMTR_s00092p00166700 [Amborella trichopoda]|uniref:Uncharacterized protein n=1 Tax=Amborella trichopoda TaxID=13333 RepID=W1NQS4_AMBTC|nr:hypothetical protein AMTR_s00092p00166700 [Amborella trichopoda]
MEISEETQAEDVGFPSPPKVDASSTEPSSRYPSSLDTNIVNQEPLISAILSLDSDAKHVQLEGSKIGNSHDISGTNWKMAVEDSILAPKDRLAKYSEGRSVGGRRNEAGVEFRWLQ